MKIAREVILDLLPLYAAGEGSPETRALVGEYLEHDAELRARLQAENIKSLAARSASRTMLPANLELRSLRRTQGVLRWQRRLYGWGLALSLVSLGGIGSLQNGRPVFHFFLRDYPQVFGPCISLALSCWISYFILRWRLRSAKP